jgi:hypothetical protein
MTASWLRASGQRIRETLFPLLPMRAIVKIITMPKRYIAGSFLPPSPWPGAAGSGIGSRA